MSKNAESKGNLIKETNYKKILQLVCKGENLTKLDIAYTLKISIPTVTTNINELKEAGIIEEVESNIYTGGRKPKVIQLIPTARISIGVSVTKDKVRVVAMNLLNEVVADKEKEYDTDYFMEYIKFAKELIDEIVTELGIKEENILGVGISIPGTVNRKLGIAEETNMGYRDIKLTEFDEILPYPVYVENEANLSLIAEKMIGGYEELQDMIYLGINEGLGGGIFVNGRLFKGVSGRAGEFGHMQVYLPKFIAGENIETYEKPKCVEDYMSTNSLVKRYNEAAKANIKYFTDFEKLINEQDEIAKEVLSEGVHILLMTIYNLAIIFDIQKIIIGGKVGRLVAKSNMSLMELMKVYKSKFEHLNLDVTVSEMKNTTTMGAALLPLMDYFKVEME